MAKQKSFPERCLKEYANIQRNALLNNKLMRPDIKTKGLESIDRIVLNRERGLITLNEAMAGLSDIFGGLCDENGKIQI